MTGLTASDLSAFGGCEVRLLLTKEEAYERLLPRTRRGAGNEDPTDYDAAKIVATRTIAIGISARRPAPVIRDSGGTLIPATAQDLQDCHGRDKERPQTEQSPRPGARH